MLKFLIVDDDERWRERLRDLLQRHLTITPEITTASDYPGALSAISGSKVKYDLIFVNYELDRNVGKHEVRRIWEMVMSPASRYDETSETGAIIVTDETTMSTNYLSLFNDVYEEFRIFGIIDKRRFELDHERYLDQVQNRVNQYLARKVPDEVRNALTTTYVSGVVKIAGTNGDLLGSGFLIYKYLRWFVVTCAHIFKGEREPDFRVGSLKAVRHLQDKCPEQLARIVYCQPPEGKEELDWSAEEDIAILELLSPPPLLIGSLRLATSMRVSRVPDNLWFLGTVGNPGKQRGRYLTGYGLMGPVERGFIQIGQRDPSGDVLEGVSGTPMADGSGAIHGMVQAMRSNEALYLIPAELISSTLSGLTTLF